MMGTYCNNNLVCNLYYPHYSIINRGVLSRRNSSCQNPIYFGFHKHRFGSVLAGIGMEEVVKEVNGENERRFRWIEVGKKVTIEQRQAISELPFRMSNRSKALMRQIICFSAEKGTISDLLESWVRIMNPIRADWLSVLKELRIMEHPVYLEVAKHALQEESFEVNIRDYTKIIHYYGKHNLLEDAENFLTLMKEMGFIYDQVILTTMVHMYSKAGHHDRAKEYFEEIKLLGEPLDKRSYGAMIMAYIRAGMPEEGENLLQEMETQEITAGSEVYKALLRAYSLIGNAEGAQRVFDAIQLAGITPNDKMCSLVVNAYAMTGQSQKALIAFENMRKASFKPTDKCIASVLVAYEKEGKINTALEFLLDLEKDGIVVGEEASAVLAKWFRKLGVVEEVELVLRDFATSHQIS
ncbi:Pentatricopeptide repeat-containing protein [Vigna angularis]|uniref:Pentatricopeptide repeat-containing protein n=3 Tax=Phaseolus angularis TaxID=3914 RepID=A0A8T0KWW6_PHAAN|nr:pentatricopeptide repeat-containing protein At1g01970 [Vigna angularis]XP_017416063.1 pentatricopeptide repeat-containing protein At1g01970 [Vigna angularis]XP_017416064.1 pentatricopeptide repeat-containing protein At1g01970 [Vigna angularis]XP_017416065.1 pentatricopeptide repeat-containing protein At1g01970 [Vigna angularis]XP_052728760.1 pentatricopeptide repeat-containing protein At1g01970 [Vigna angularis]XP_052728761.1 pentatricopeptide repeat-containing protein At1g01970 [Vigna angu